MTEQTNLEDKIRDLLDYWEGFTRGEPHHVSAAGVLKQLRDLLPDSPLPDPLFLAKATHSEYGEGVVTSHNPDGDGTVRFMFTDEAIGDGTNYHWVDTSDLTFHTPDHPEFLETEEDYASAPNGTIVVDDDEKRIVLIDERWFSTVSSASFDHGDMAGIRRRVLRWGWEV